MEKESAKGKGTVRFGFKTSKTLRKTNIRDSDLGNCYKTVDGIAKNLTRLQEEQQKQEDEIFCKPKTKREKKRQQVQDEIKQAEQELNATKFDEIKISKHERNSLSK